MAPDVVNNATVLLYESTFCKQTRLKWDKIATSAVIMDRLDACGFAVQASYKTVYTAMKSFTGGNISHCRFGMRMWRTHELGGVRWRC